VREGEWGRLQWDCRAASMLQRRQRVSSSPGGVSSRRCASRTRKQPSAARDAAEVIVMGRASWAEGRQGGGRRRWAVLCSVANPRPLAKPSEGPNAHAAEGRFRRRSKVRLATGSAIHSGLSGPAREGDRKHVHTWRDAGMRRDGLARWRPRVPESHGAGGRSRGKLDRRAGGGSCSLMVSEKSHVVFAWPTPVMASPAVSSSPP